MSLSTDQILGIVFAVMGISLIALYLFYNLSKKRARMLREQADPDSSADHAFNQLNTTRAIILRAKNDGKDVALAQEKLADAEALVKSGDVRQGSKLAREARDLVRSQPTSAPATRKRMAVEKRPTLEDDSLRFRDLSKKLGEPETEEPTPGTEPDVGGGTATAPPEEIPPLQEFRQKAEKNYLEARFERQMLESDLGNATGRTADEAHRLLADSNRAFERKDYTESLRLAMRGRKVLAQPSTSNIAVSPGTTVETPPEEPSPASLRSSAPPVEPEVTVEAKTGKITPTTVKCSKCGKSNPAKNRFCRSCGEMIGETRCPRCQVKVEPNDTFCGSCGAPLAASS